jgi:hypothetical protein
VLRADVQTLLDLDAVGPTLRQSVDDVVGAVPVERVVGPGDLHHDVGSGGRVDGAGDLLPELLRRQPADEHDRLAETVEADGVREPARRHRGEQREAAWISVVGGDVPALEGAVVVLPSPAQPPAGIERGETGCHVLGLAVGVELDVAPVGCDGDEGRARAIVQPFDELAELLSLGVIQRRMRDLRVEDAVELVVAPEPPAAEQADAHDTVRVLVAGFADREEDLVVGRGHDAHLTADVDADLEQLPSIDRAVLASVLEILLRVQRLADLCVTSDHQISSGFSNQWSA